MDASRTMARITTTTQKKNTMMRGWHLRIGHFVLNVGST